MCIWCDGRCPCHRLITTGTRCARCWMVLITIGHAHAHAPGASTDSPAKGE